MRRISRLALITGIAAVTCVPAPASADVSLVRTFPVTGESVAVDASTGNVYTSAPGLIERYDSTGIDNGGFAVPSQFTAPNDIDFADGHVFAVDAGVNRLHAWEPDGGNQVTSPASSADRANMSRGLEISGDFAFVGTGETNSIVKLRAGGAGLFGDFIERSGWGVVDGTEGSGYQTCGAPGACTQFGFSGTALGRINDARDIAIGPGGEFYVIEKGTGAGPPRIEQFTGGGTGTFRAIGQGQGSGSGQFNSPFGIAVDATGDIFVADSFNHRINQFAESGAFERAFGFGVATGANELETCTSGCRAGISGTDPGQLSVPYKLAFDGVGRLYVSQISNQRVTVYDVGVVPPTGGGGAGAGGGPVDPVVDPLPPPVLPALDRTPPTFRLTAKEPQKLSKRVSVIASGASETITLSTAGKLSTPGPDLTLGKVSTNVPAGGSVNLRPKLSAKARGVAEKALRNGDKVLAKITVTARDASGNSSSERVSFKLKD